MPTKLSVFNEALRILGQTILTSPDVLIESARQLRDAFEPSVSACYEAGNWKATIVRMELPRAATVPDWGYKYYYTLPGDFVRVVQLSSTGARNDHMTDYELEKGKIACDAEALYLRYVSCDLKTLAPGSWTQAFADFVSATMAVRTAPKLNPSALEAASQIQASSRIRALSLDAIQNPPAKRRPGSFVQAVTQGSRTRTEQG